jgi:hypothetical protein
MLTDANQDNKTILIAPLNWGLVMRRAVFQKNITTKKPYPMLQMGLMSYYVKNFPI